MFEWLHSLSNWTLDLADSDAAIVALVLVAFSESIIFPIPPDPLLIGIGIRQPEMALPIAAFATIASVSGAIAGRWLGRRFGRPLLHRIVSESKADAAERLFQKYGAWAVFVAAFTPIPYKVFAIMSGILDMNLRGFVIASLLGRGTRFFTLGVLLLVFGESIEELIDESFEYLTIGFAVVVLLVGVLYFVLKRRGARGDHGAA